MVPRRRARYAAAYGSDRVVLEEGTLRCSDTLQGSATFKGGSFMDSKVQAILGELDARNQKEMEDFRSSGKLDRNEAALAARS